MLTIVKFQLVTNTIVDVLEVAHVEKSCKKEQKVISTYPILPEFISLV